MWGSVRLPTAVVFLVFVAMVSAQRGQDVECPEYIYAFGNSYTDTGNAQAELPALFSLNYPYGKSYRFPDRPDERTRYCNGRLVIDFTTQAFRFPFIEPYSRHFPEYRYRRGVNFAYSGGTAAITAAIVPGFYFQHETDNYLSFHRNFTDSHYNISTALHLVTEIGGNDFAYAYLVYGQSPDEAIVTVAPRVLAAVKANLEEMYNAGARLFVVFNIPPGGCTSYFLTLYEGKSPKDEYGCLLDYNRAFDAYNQMLNATMYEYRQNWTDVKIFIFDYFSATYEVVKHPETYGFDGRILHVACCGYGGKYNYNPLVMCGAAGYVPDPNGGPSQFVNITESCPRPDEYVLWDGMHSTEAFYRVMARFFLTGRFMDGPDRDCLNLQELCNLDFNEWD